MKSAFFLATMSLFLLTASAAAGETKGDSVTLTFKNEDQAKCVAKCLQTEAPKAKPAPKKPVKRKRRVRRKRRPRCPRCCFVLKAEVNRIQVEVNRLSGQVGLLNGRDASLNKRLSQLKKRLSQLEKRQADLGDELVDFGRIQANLRLRVLQLERRSSLIRLSPVAGFLAFYSTDKTQFTGGILGVRLATNLTSKLEVGIEPTALLSVSDRPFGNMVRGYLGYAGLTSRFAFEAGFSGAWCGHNAQAEAQSLLVSGDLGAMVFLYKGLWANLRVHLGAELDQDSPAFAVGGALSVGYEF